MEGPSDPDPAMLDTPLSGSDAQNHASGGSSFASFTVGSMGLSTEVFSGYNTERRCPINAICLS